MDEAPPAESRGTRTAPVREQPEAAEELLAAHFRYEPPRVVVKADILPAVSALSTVALLGLPLGWVWSRLALPKESVITESGDLVPLMLVESYHEFDGLGLFLLLSFAMGVLVAAGLWMLRERRGPVMLLAGVLGSLVAAWLGMRTGTSLAAGLYPAPARPEVGGLVSVAPELSQQWAVLAAPLAVALAYGLATAWNGMDDLGRRLR